MSDNTRIVVCTLLFVGLVLGFQQGCNAWVESLSEFDIRVLELEAK